MADYYPPIAQAVNGLDKNTVQTRRAIYDLARTAMLTQLRGVTPPLNESDINREQLALEQAIRKVETESLRRSRTPTRSSIGQPDPPPRSAPGLGDQQAELSNVGAVSKYPTRPSPSMDRPHD